MIKIFFLLVGIFNMINSYYVQFRTNDFPSNSEIESFARSIDSNFRLDQSFDFLNTKGFCPCRYNKKKQGFEWDFTVNSKEITNATGELIFRSDLIDGVCALLAATSIAFLTNGSMQYENNLLSGRDLLEFTKDEMANYFMHLEVIKKRKKSTAEESLLLAIASLKNSRVKQLVQVDIDMSDPLISIVFNNNSNLIGKRWTLKLNDGFKFTTQDLPVYRLSDNHMNILKKIVNKLKTIMSTENIVEFKYDKESLNIEIYFETATLLFHPNSTFNAEDMESKIFLGINQNWEFIDRSRKTTIILPDLNSKTLVFL